MLMVHRLCTLPGHTVFKQYGLAKGKVKYMGEEKTNKGSIN